jgi:hypothetical protein
MFVLVQKHAKQRQGMNPLIDYPLPLNKLMNRNDDILVF